MIRKTRSWLLLASALFAAHVRAGLYIVNPNELKEQMGAEGEVASKLSNIGFRNFQKGTSRIGQVIYPLMEDGQGCSAFSWDDDFTFEEMQHFTKQEGFFLLLKRRGCSFA